MFLVYIFKQTQMTYMLAIFPLYEDFKTVIHSFSLYSESICRLVLKYDASLHQSLVRQVLTS